MDGKLVATAALLFLVGPVHGLWWAMGSPVLLDPTRVCRKSRRLRPRQAEICRNETEIVREVGKGAQLGTRECHHQFRSDLWNCSTSRRSLKKLLAKDIREASFINAITAAGVTYAVTQACSSGQLFQCSCDRSIRGKSSEGDWEWGGCGDNVMFGYRKSKEFMDTFRRRKSDLRTLVLLHNNEAGRLAVRNFLRTECKCHGLSGSCTVRTCWKKMPPFRDVGNRLRDKYDGAVKVIPGNDGKHFIPETSSMKPPDKEDLVYSEQSPNFCEPNRKTGSLGTHGRECNATSRRIDGCALLCCGREYKQELVHEIENCRCRFKWCCEVTCDRCNVTRTISRCK